jgi:hypothetical protein
MSYSRAAADGISGRIAAAEFKYGPPASTHEAMGVALEEWQELQSAVHINDLAAIREEALDLAAILIRMYDELRPDSAMAERSGCGNA